MVTHFKAVNDLNNRVGPWRLGGSNWYPPQTLQCVLEIQLEAYSSSDTVRIVRMVRMVRIITCIVQFQHGLRQHTHDPVKVLVSFREDKVGLHNGDMVILYIVENVVVPHCVT